MTTLPVRLAGTNQQVTTASPSKKTLPVPTQRFTNEPLQTFAQSLSKFHTDPKGAKLAVEARSGQTNVARQNSVAARRASVATPIGFNALVPASTNAAPPAAAPTPAPSPAPADSVQSADDIYWSKQPAEVQQLRTMPDIAQRGALAFELATKGYSIDVPVMVWGWDAAKTTELRQGYGYTWVPSALQTPVTAAPGISGGNITPYDPAHPPQGSILV
jgi:hypothetical protein